MSELWAAALSRTSVPLGHDRKTDEHCRSTCTLLPLSSSTYTWRLLSFFAYCFLRWRNQASITSALPKLAIRDTTSQRQRIFFAIYTYTCYDFYDYCYDLRLRFCYDLCYDLRHTNFATIYATTHDKRFSLPFTLTISAAICAMRSRRKEGGVWDVMAILHDV